MPLFAPAPVISAQYTLIASSTLDSSGNTFGPIAIPTIPTYRTQLLLVYTLVHKGTVFPVLTFNSDTGSNYASNGQSSAQTGINVGLGTGFGTILTDHSSMILPNISGEYKSFSTIATSLSTATPTTGIGMWMNNTDPIGSVTFTTSDFLYLGTTFSAYALI